MSQDYNRLPVRSVGSGFSSGESRWTPFRRFSPTPVSNVSFNGIVTPLEAGSGGDTLFEGMPIRYQTVAGGDTYFYANIQLLTINEPAALDVIYIHGPDLTGQTISAMWTGTSEMVIPAWLMIPGVFAASSGNILNAVGKTRFQWHNGPAALVYYKAWAYDAGDGTAKIVPKIEGAAVDATGVTCPTTGAGSGVRDATKYSIAYADNVEIGVTVTDTSASDLTVLTLWVLE